MGLNPLRISHSSSDTGHQLHIYAPCKCVDIYAAVQQNIMVSTDMLCQQIHNHSYSLVRRHSVCSKVLLFLRTVLSWAKLNCFIRLRSEALSFF